MNETASLDQTKMIEYFVEKKKKGLSFREIDNLFKIKNVDDETRRLIMKQLSRIDRQQRIEKEQSENKHKRWTGTRDIFIGIGVMILGVLIYLRTAKAGVVFNLNIIILGFGLITSLRGLLRIAGTYIKD